MLSHQDVSHIVMSILWVYLGRGIPLVTSTVYTVTGISYFYGASYKFIWIKMVDISKYGDMDSLLMTLEILCVDI